MPKPKPADAEPDATPSPTPLTRPVQVPRFEFAGTEPGKGPWYKLSVVPAPEDVPALTAALTAASGAARAEAERVRAEFLAGPEAAAVAAAEKRLADNAAALSAAEQDLARTTEEWRAASGLAAVNPGRPGPQVKELEQKLRDLTARIAELKTEFPPVLTEAVNQSKQAARDKLRELVLARLGEVRAASEARERDAQARLGAAVRAAFGDWLVASYERDGARAAGGEIARLARLH